MADRVKMSRQERAKQFAPFDALKGLHEAIKMKEFEHEMVFKNELCEDEVKNISDVLLQLKKNDLVQIKFFRDGHIIDLQGKSELDIINQVIKVGVFVIDFDDIRKIEIVKNEKKASV